MICPHLSTKSMKIRGNSDLFVRIFSILVSIYQEILGAEGQRRTVISRLHHAELLIRMQSMP